MRLTMPECGKCWNVHVSALPHSGPVLPADGSSALQLRLSWLIRPAVLCFHLLDGISNAQLGYARDGEPGVPVGRVLHPLDEVVSQVNGELLLLVVQGGLRLGLGTNRRDDALRFVGVRLLSDSVRDERC